MGRRITLSSLALPILLAWVPFAMMPTAAGYLCVGMDGHVALESGANGACADVASDNAGSAPSIGNTMPEDHCGPCVDASLDLHARVIKSAAPTDCLAGAVHLATAPTIAGFQLPQDGFCHCETAVSRTPSIRSRSVLRL